MLCHAGSTALPGSSSEGGNVAPVRAPSGTRISIKTLSGRISGLPAISAVGAHTALHLKDSVWAQIGVTAKHGTVGHTMEPPAAIEYAVDPVGVATMMPSAYTVVTSARSVPRACATHRLTVNQQVDGR